MFEHILVPMDRSALAECVLPHAVAVARSLESRATLLHVMEYMHRADLRRTVDPLDWQIRRAEAETYLDDLAERVRQAGLAAHWKVLEGQAAEQVVEFTQTQCVDLITLSSHGQSGLSGWNVSSVVQKIALRANASVMIVRAYQPAADDWAGLRYRRILVPLDGSQRAEYTLPVAATLARTHEAQLLLVHVVQRPVMPRRTLSKPEDMGLAEQLVERNRIEAGVYLDELAARSQVDVRTQVVVSDHPVATLHELVEREQADLVVLTAHGYSGSMHWPYGSMTISFIAYGTTPVLIVQDIPRGQAGTTPAELAVREPERH